MISAEKAAAYLTLRKWIKIYNAEPLWSTWFDAETGDDCLEAGAICRQIGRDFDASIDAMLRLPALLERINAVRQLWNSPAWCDPEMRDAMAALFAEVDRG